MWKWAKRIKDIYSWFGFVSTILGALGLTAIISGIGVTVIGVVGAVIKGLPWPFVLMAAYCTMVGMAYLAALPFFIRALRPTDQAALTPSAKKPRVLPQYEAWKHVEKFNLREAAYLWVQLEPHAHRESPEAAAWVEAFSGAIRTGKLGFLPRALKAGPYAAHDITDQQREWDRQRQQQNPDSTTEVSREQLVKFAKDNDEKPKFLEN